IKIHARGPCETGWMPLAIQAGMRSGLALRRIWNDRASAIRAMRETPERRRRSSGVDMKRRYFGTDGIRGQSNVFPMTPDLAMRVGIAVGTIFRRGAHRHRVVIGKDTRLSGYMLENAMVAGFTAAGIDAFVLGPIPTPAVAMLTRSPRADIGVMISASHNPFQDNGIKLFGPDGYKLSDELEAEIEELLDKDITPQLADATEIGRAKRIDGVHDRYIEHAKRTLPRDVTLKGLRVAIDCA